MKEYAKNKKLLAGIVLAAVVLVVVIWCLFSGNKSENDGAVKDNAPETETSKDATATPENDELQKNANEKINTVVNNYLTACKEGKMEELETLVSNGEELTKEQVQKPYEYVEKIQNVDCYTLDGPDEGTYLVYVYYELKFVNVETVAPGLMQLYISSTSDDSLVIMLDELDAHVQEAREAALNREDVQALIKLVNEKLTEAANTDADLKALITKMNTEDTTAAPEATQTPEATKAAE